MIIGELGPVKPLDMLIFDIIFSYPALLDGITLSYFAFVTMHA